MNAERLRELVDFLIHAEQRLDLQSKADRLQAALQNLTTQPAEPSYQNEVVHALDDLQNTLGPHFYDDLSPAERAALSEINAEPFFGPEMAQSVRSYLADNTMTPSIVTSSFNLMLDKRREYIISLHQLSESLGRLGVEAYTPVPGEAELGILIPRDLFHNKLDPFSKELHTLNTIISLFSEAATGTVEDPGVKQISTTDPIIYLCVGVPTVAMIAKSVSWILDTWKSALEIKELRNRAKAISFDEDELKIFENKVDKLIDAKVKERVAEIMETSKTEGPRSQEVENGLIWAHRALLARIERGMTLDVRFLPPAEPLPDDEVSPHAADFETLRVLSPTLEFPTPSGAPILRLPSSEPPKAPKGPSA